ncbi:hypothetical protein BRARA_I04358 [Brassica rapa]|uniref:DUF4408 domain-containing protein n=2 Tax=Brassica campestris TaxID=3711 RepID=A0A397Y2G8_BRACM|nr:hypothetical protein BRARA_I04358 [Brassica rapa]
MIIYKKEWIHMLPQLITFCVLCLLSLVEEKRKTQIMNTKNNVLVDVSPFLLFEASADSETREEGGHVGYDDKGHGNDAESTSQVTGGLADFDSVEMEEEEEKEEELVTGEKEEEHEEEEVNSHVRWPEKRENESGSVDASSTRNDERLMRRKIEKDRMFWEACLAS